MTFKENYELRQWEEAYIKKAQYCVDQYEKTGNDLFAKEAMRTLEEEWPIFREKYELWAATQDAFHYEKLMEAQGLHFYMFTGKMPKRFQ